MPSIFDRLGTGLERIIGVPQRGALPEQQRQVARQQGLLRLGTSLLQQSQPTEGPPVGTLAGIGTAIERAQGATALSVESQRELAIQQRRQRILDSFMGRDTNDPSVLRQIMTSLIAVGDNEGANAVGQALNSIGESSMRLEQVDLGDSIQLVDPVTGQVLRVVPKGVNSPEKERADQNKALRTNALIGRFNSATRLLTEVALAYRGILEATSTPKPTQPGDLALIINFMKMLDPGSIVRESEFGLVVSSATVPNQLVGLYNKLASGKGSMSDPQRDNILEQARRKAVATSQLFQIQRERFLEVAANEGAFTDPFNFDPFEGLLAPGSTGKVGKKGGIGKTALERISNLDASAIRRPK